MAYATAAELRTLMDKTGTTGSGSDTALGVVLNGVSDMIDRFFNRPSGWFVALTVATTRTYPGSGRAHQAIDENVEVTLVEVKDSPTDTTYTTWAAADWIAYSGNHAYPDFNDLPYDGLMVNPSGSYAIFTSGKYYGLRGFTPIESIGRSVPTVRVTAKWGYSVACPAVIKQATLSLSARWFKEGQGAWADTLASSDFGGLLYKSQNADIKAMLETTRFFKPALGVV